MTMHLKKPRGSILLFTIVLVIPLLLIVAGAAVDVSMLYAVRSELHRSMDAAALAGAGNLGFNATAFPAVRAAAQSYAAQNPYLQSGVITLDLNPANNNPPMSSIPIGGGDIVLGVWNGTTRTFDVPGCDITSSSCLHSSGFPYFNMINAVRCRTRQSLPTYFLNLIGLSSLDTWAESIAPSYPPMGPPPSGCTFPIGVSDCPFRNAGSSTYGSAGCGAMITFIDANTNTSGWVNLGGDLGGTTSLTQTPSASTLQSEINMAASSSGTGCATPPPPGTSVGMSGGMVQSAYDLLANLNPGTGALQSGSNYFVANYGGDLTVDNSDSDPATYTYRGPGWKVYVPIVYSNNNCGTPENMNQPHTIAAYAEIVIVQVINNGWCAVQNTTPLPGYAGPGPNPWSNMCPAPRGTAATRDSNLRAIFAYYKCGTWDSPPVIAPAPRAALADRLRLVR
jgi:hypothetical protein